MHDDRDKGDPVPLRRGGEAIHGLGGEAGFEPGAALIAVHQLVGVHQLEGPAPDAVHPDGGETLDLLMPHQLPGEDGDVPGGGVVLLIVKESGAVGEMGVEKAQFLGPLVHSVHK